MIIQASNNSRFEFRRNLAGLAQYFDLPNATFRMRVKKSPGDGSVLLDFVTGGSPDGIVYDLVSKDMVATTSSARVADMLGTYVFDFGFTPLGGDFTRIDGGDIVMQEGISR